jgi:hypothetical protein
MRNALIAIILCGAAVAATESRTRDEAVAAADITADRVADVATDWDDRNRNDKADGVEMEIHADTESGELNLKLPGGLEGRVKLPEGLEPDAKFDLDGVGRYPGATLSKVDVSAGGNKADRHRRVVLGFSAPGSADQVASWYEKAFAADGRAVTRAGTTLTGRTSEGNDLVMVISDGSSGRAQGRITITDRDS